MATSDDRAAIQAAIVHELTHIRRGDLWLLALCRWLTVVFFAHPGIWWLQRQMRIDQELLADAAASAKMKPVRYAELLLLWSCKQSRLPNFGVKMAQATLLHRRIAVLLDERVRIDDVPSRRLKRSTAIVTAISVMALSLITLKPQAHPTHRVTEAALAAQVSGGKSETRPSNDDVSEGLSSESRPARLEPTWDCTDPLKVDLPHSISLELVGIRDHPCWGDRRWSADGQLPARAHPSSQPDPLSPMANIYEVVLRVHNPEGAWLDWDHAPGFSQLSGDVESDSAHEQLVGFTLSSTDAAANLCLGLSVGPWVASKESGEVNSRGPTEYLTCDGDDTTVVTLPYPRVGCGNPRRSARCAWHRTRRQRRDPRQPGSHRGFL